jgi:arsenate reductase
MLTIYGIRNCDTMKKAMRWLDGAGVAYTFHDFRVAGIEPGKLAAWCASLGWEKLLNRRGLTWRKLDDSQKLDIDETRAIALMAEYPTLIKRPVLEFADYNIEVGFSPARYEALLSSSA